MGKRARPQLGAAHRVNADSAINQANRNLGIAIGISVAALASALIINRRLIQGFWNRCPPCVTPVRTRRLRSEASMIPNEDILDYSCEMNQHSGRELVDLNAAIQAMVSAFNERTQELAEKEQQALALMSNKLKISLEAASIAHEINQPLSVIQLTAQSLLNQTHGKQMERFQTNSEAGSPCSVSNRNAWVRSPIRSRRCSGAPMVATSA